MKDTLLEEIAEKIDYVAYSTIMLEGLCDKYNLTLDAAPLSNFRDGLFHFVKLYENKEEDKIFYGNLYATEEHLARGLKDIIIYFCAELPIRLQRLNRQIAIQGKKISEKIRLQKLIFEIREISLKVRSNFGSLDTKEIDLFLSDLSTASDSVDDLLSDWEIDPMLLKQKALRQ